VEDTALGCHNSLGPEAVEVEELHIQADHSYSRLPGRDIVLNKERAQQVSDCRCAYQGDIAGNVYQKGQL
jgi:hypothetical protein